MACVPTNISKLWKLAVTTTRIWHPQKSPIPRSYDLVRFRSMSTSSQKRQQRQRKVKGKRGQKLRQANAAASSTMANASSNTKEGVKPKSSFGGIDPSAFFFLGLFPLLATGALVFVRDDLRDQVIANWSPPSRKKEEEDTSSARTRLGRG